MGIAAKLMLCAGKIAHTGLQILPVYTHIKQRLNGDLKFGRVQVIYQIDQYPFCAAMSQIGNQEKNFFTHKSPRKARNDMEVGWNLYALSARSTGNKLRLRQWS